MSMLPADAHRRLEPMSACPHGVPHRWACQHCDWGQPELLTCPFCGIKDTEVCDSLPSDTCERALRRTHL